jgi:hypothetical protein
MNLEAVLSNPKVIRAVTSLDADEFETLAQTFQTQWDAALARRTAEGQRRQRVPGAGVKGVLPTARHKLFFILLYCKLYPLQPVMQILFGLSQPQVSEWVGRLLPALEQALGKKQVLPARKAKDLAEVLKLCPGLEFCLDGTERRVPRPVDREQQKARYSGRRKAHTVKNVVLTSGGEVIGLSETVAGRVHDKKAAEAAWGELAFPPGSGVLRDSGFIGLTCAGAAVEEPFKKPKGGELTDAQKESNRALARRRVKVEHGIGGVKRCRIVREVFRNRREGMEDQVMLVASGLHHFRWRSRMNF